MARFALEQTELNCKSVGINPAAFPDDRGRWLMACALVDLEKGEKLFEAELANVGVSDAPDLLFQGIVNTSKLLATPPEHRDSVLRSSFPGDAWRPGS